LIAYYVVRQDNGTRKSPSPCPNIKTQIKKKEEGKKGRNKRHFAMSRSFPINQGSLGIGRNRIDVERAEEGETMSWPIS
jgi:hypothetical protein